ncbi:hypothetical protein CgIS1_22485 [Frankia sp. CgS1]|nr:hypothetical protein CgIS1_22485 [Frankia sp. CgIS1]
MAELPVWQRILTGDDVLLGDRPLDPARDVASSMRQLSFSVSLEVTAALLTTVPTLFHAGINDVLLAGLAAAVTEWRRRRGDGASEAIVIDLEGHGREPLAEDVELSRTVGWFTRVHPVRLELPDVDLADLRAGGPAAGRIIKEVKEQVRAVPGEGLGYGLLRHLNPATRPVLAALPTPQIAFNYLGRFAGARRTGEDTDWQPIGLDGEAGDLPAAHVLEAGGAVRDGADGPELTVSLAWPPGVLAEPAVRELGEGWVAMLTGLAEHAARPEAGGHTPSDFPLLELGQRQVEQFEAMAAEIEKGTSS